jgi:UDP-GlcNAc:undecaprenyl-phosphate GlcNAc-1-phosphate transferase
MIIGLSEIFRTILFSSFCAVALSPLMIWISKKINLMDQPGSAHHKQHDNARPMAGGLVILLSLGVSIAILPMEISRSIQGILIAIFVIFAVGIIDDRFSINAGYKLFGQLFAAGIIFIFGVQVHITQIPLLDAAITFVWLVGLTNAFNFVDSMDGLAVGLAGIASAFFMLVTSDSSQPDLALLSALLLGISIGCFLFTAPPARMFLGDSGSQIFGLALAAIGIAFTPGEAGLPQASTWFIPILVLGVPIFDMFLVVFSRMRRRQLIYQAGMDHVYHRLSGFGLHPNHAVSVMQVAAIILSLAAFILMGATPLVANLGLAVLLLTGIAIFIYFEYRLSRAD